MNMTLNRKSKRIPKPPALSASSADTEGQSPLFPRQEPLTPGGQPEPITEVPAETARKRQGKTAAASAAKKEVEAAPADQHAHLIRIPDNEARKRAIMAFGEVPRPYCGFTDYQMLVTNEHLEILR